MKKTLSVALTILMIISMSSMMVFNAEIEPEVKVSASYVIKEDTVVATVSIDNTTDRAVAALNVTLKFDTDKLEFDKSIKGSFIKNNGKSPFANALLVVSVDDASSFNMTLADADVGVYNDGDPEDILDKRDLGKGKGDIAIVTFKIKSGASITECPFELYGKDGDESIVDIKLTSFTASYTINPPIADYAALDAAIADAEALVEDSFTAYEWAYFAEALSTARAAKEFDAFKQAQINAAANALIYAFNSLVNPEVKVSVNYVINEDSVVATVSIDNTTDRAVAALNVTLKFDTDKLEFEKSIKGSFTKNNGKSPFANAILAVDIDDAASFNMTLADTEVGIYNDGDPEDILDKRDLGKGKGDIAIVTFKIKSGVSITESPFELFGKDGYGRSIVDFDLTSFTSSYTVNPPIADYTALDAAIAAAEALTEANFTVDSWIAVAAALETAKAAKAFDAFKQADIDAAAGALVNAISSLRVIVFWVVDGAETPETYNINAIPTYKGEAPVKASDDQYNYTFTGWTDGTNEYTADATLPAVAAAVTYTATFSKTLRFHIGDVDLSGDEPTIADALLLFKYVAGVTAISDSATLIVADIDGNGGITIADALLLFKFVAGIISEI